MSGLKIWQATIIITALFIIAILSVLSFYLILKKKSRRTKTSSLPIIIQTPPVSKEIKEVRIEHVSNSYPQEKNSYESEKILLNLEMEKKIMNGVSSSGSGSGEEGSLCVANRSSSSLYEMATPSPSPLSGLQESHLGWGHWFTLRDLEIATNGFSKENVIGEGGYGVVYRGELTNGTYVAVKKIMNHL